MTAGLLQAYGLTEEGAGTCSLQDMESWEIDGQEYLDQLRIRYNIKENVLIGN